MQEARDRKAVVDAISAAARGAGTTVSRPGVDYWTPAARRAEPGWQRVIFVITALATTLVALLFFTVGMMAP